MLGHNIHGDLGQIHVRTDSCGGRNASSIQHLPDHLHDQLMGRHFVGVQVAGQVDENFINGIDEDVISTDVFHIGRDYLCADLLVELHTGRGDDVS